jgi:cell division protein FtsB
MSGSGKGGQQAIKHQREFRKMPFGPRLGVLLFHVLCYTTRSLAIGAHAYSDHSRAVPEGVQDGSLH